jgi:OOP family OmpA-OmpF porin
MDVTHQRGHALSLNEEVRSMPSQRFLSTAVLAASLLAGLVGCGGVTQFQGGSAFAINGTPPAPPPPPPPVKEEIKQPARVELRDNKIEFKEKIQFEVAKSTIKPESYGLLKEIAEVIKKNPQVKKISIEGHASAEGDAKQNKTLSDSRAKSVMDHLKTKEGVDGNRMLAKGWGIEKPIAPNDTEENREKNRRVEFLVVEQDVTQKKVEIDPKTGQEKVVDSKTTTTATPGGAATPATPATPPAKGLTKKPEVKK